MKLDFVIEDDKNYTIDPSISCSTFEVDVKRHFLFVEISF